MSNNISICKECGIRVKDRFEGAFHHMQSHPELDEVEFEIIERQ